MSRWFQKGSNLEGFLCCCEIAVNLWRKIDLQATLDSGLFKFLKSNQEPLR